MNMRNLTLTTVGCAAALAALQATAANVTTTGSIETLTFGGQVNAANINGFFNGGTDSYGTAGGTANNVGISFSTPAEFLNAGYNGTGFNGGTGKFENVPSAATGVLYLASVPTTTVPVLDDVNGFSSVSFNYSLLNNTAAYASTVSVYSGLNGTGSLLGSLTLSPAGTATACTSTHDEFCSWSSTGTLMLSGVGQSLVFNGDARTYTEFDAVSLNTAVPLPAGLWLMLGGLGGLTGFMRRRPA